MNVTQFAPRKTSLDSDVMKIVLLLLAFAVVSGHGHGHGHGQDADDDQSEVVEAAAPSWASKRIPGCSVCVACDECRYGSFVCW